MADIDPSRLPMMLHCGEHVRISCPIVGSYPSFARFVKQCPLTLSDLSLSRPSIQFDV